MPDDIAPDTLNEIGVLKRREIEARILAPLISALAAEFGRERVIAIAKRVIVEIARKHGVHPAVICIQWAVQRGQTPIPFSANRKNILANLQGAVSGPLTPEEMTAIGKLDRNCRLIKGQVFLWRENQTWEDLWDLNGEIVR